jgi:hypothetical protein
MKEQLQRGQSEESERVVCDVSMITMWHSVALCGTLWQLCRALVPAGNRLKDRCLDRGSPTMAIYAATRALVCVCDGR